MLPVLLIIYGVYVVLVGAHGNAPALLNQLDQEKQFIYWSLVILVVMALWETNAGSKIAKPFALLIVIGFLLHNGNYQKIVAGAKTVFPGL